MIYHQNDAFNEKYFRLKVTSIDQGDYIDDAGEKSANSIFQDSLNSRSLYVSGVRIDISGEPFLSIKVIQQNIGDFKLPKPGDVVWVEQRGFGSSTYYVVTGADYVEHDDANKGYHPVPLWGGIPGDYGRLHSYRDHVIQSSPNPKNHDFPDVPLNDYHFRAEWVRSITGERYRHYKESNLEKGKFVHRGDPVFDSSNKRQLSEEFLLELGAEILADSDDQSNYPNPLNVPIKREPDPVFNYIYEKYRFLPPNIEWGQPDDMEQLNIPSPEYDEYILNNKYYTAYEPISDRAYFQKTKQKKQRELIAAEQYIQAIRGNMKFEMTDHYGDGEQLSQILQNIYNAGFSILHNKDRGQVRLRDHLGNTILIEGNPDKPRIILITKSKQVIELGSKKVGDDYSNFFIIRNGQKFGDSDLPWGEKTGKTRDSVFNQEFIMIDNKNLITDPEFSARISSGLLSEMDEAGFYFRSVDDSKSGKYNIWSKITSDSNGDVLKFQSKLIHIQKDLEVNEFTIVDGQSETITNHKKKRFKSKHEELDETIITDASIDHVIKQKINGKSEINKITTNNDVIELKRKVLATGAEMGYVKLSDSGIEMDTKPDFKIQIGNESKDIIIGNPEANLSILGQNVDIFSTMTTSISSMGVVDISSPSVVNISGSIMSISGTANISISTPIKIGFD